MVMRRPTTAMRPHAAAMSAVLLLTLGWGARGAAAQAADAAGLDEARRELGELRYEQALATLDRALEAGTSGPAATAQIYLLLGEVRASVGQRGEAERAFQMALSIDPDLELRKGVSPKIGRPFHRAQRARRGDRPIAIAHRVVAQDPPTVAVLVQSDPLGMVAGARIIYWSKDGAARSVAGAGKDRIEIALPRGASRFTVAGIDAHGNRVAELGSDDQPLTLGTGNSARPRPAPARVAATPEVDAGPAPAPRAPRPEAAAEVAIEKRGEPTSTPFYASWLVWGGVTLGFAAVGTWAGLSANSAVNDLDDIRASNYEVEFTAAKKVADRAEQRSLIANICFGAATATAITSAVFYFRSRHDSGETDDSDVALAPVLGQGQVGMAASLRF
ncbi:MAG TPA: tetratricopeptide repeat protein [Kofleriaceae bacterium]|nr:tetratricopeptide repeat protein [Kofleriaceae bacterium]